MEELANGTSATESLAPPKASEIRYIYLEDANCRKRVLTIGYQILKDVGVMRISWCINKVTQRLRTYWDEDVDAYVIAEETLIHDEFSKTKARVIVRGRLARGRGATVTTVSYVNLTAGMVRIERYGMPMVRAVCDCILKTPGVSLSRSAFRILQENGKFLSGVC